MPCVAVLSTGDELAPSAAAQLAPTQIRDANRPMLLAAGGSLRIRVPPDPLGSWRASYPGRTSDEV